MKIEIDLNDILGDEYGAETLQESVKRQVISNLTSTLSQSVRKKIDDETRQVIDEEIRKAVAIQMPDLISNLMETEYVPVSRYGETAQSTTFRKELVKEINEQMKYVKMNWDSEKNAFSKAVDDVVSENVKTFKAEFGRQVNSQFLSEAYSYAAKVLAERAGIKQ
jgi:hypothetical protein